jgi:hypothetical protein
MPDFWHFHIQTLFLPTFASRALDLQRVCLASAGEASLFYDLERWRSKFGN